jgi:GT2 family glycosyltransferase
MKLFSYINIIINYYILPNKIKLIVGEFVLSFAGRLIRRPEYIEIAKHIKYKLGRVPMNCKKFEIKNVPEFNIENIHVTIVIPTRDHLKDLNKCIASIKLNSTYKNYDILVVNNQSDDITFDWLMNCPYADVSFVDYDHPYNYAAIHNMAIPKCQGSYIIMLNNDTEVIEPSWIEQLIGPMLNDPSIGMVGAKLLFEDNIIQHCGVIYSNVTKGFMHVNSHKCDNYPLTNKYAFYPAVTGACVAMRKDLYIDAGGMDENLAIAYNDIELCMKTTSIGYKILYSPYARLYHYESKTRGYDTTLEKQLLEFKERTYFMNKWEKYINANFK